MQLLISFLFYTLNKILVSLLKWHSESQEVPSSRDLWLRCYFLQILYNIWEERD